MPDVPRATPVPWPCPELYPWSENSAIPQRSRPTFWIRVCALLVLLASLAVSCQGQYEGAAAVSGRSILQAEARERRDGKPVLLFSASSVALTSLLPFLHLSTPPPPSV